MPNTPDEETLLAAYLEDVAELHRTGVTVEIVFSPESAWLIIAQLQLALRHPTNTGPGAEKARQVIHALASVMAPTPATKEVLRRGFEAEYDVPS